MSSEPPLEPAASHPAAMYVSEKGLTALPDGGERVRRFVYPLVEIAAYLPFHRSGEREAKLKRELKRLTRVNIALGLEGESRAPFASKDPKKRYSIEKRDLTIRTLEKLGTLESEDKLARLSVHFRLVALQLPQPIATYRVYRRFMMKEAVVYVEEIEGERLGNPFIISPHLDRDEHIIALLQDFLARGP